MHQIKVDLTHERFELQSWNLVEALKSTIWTRPNDQNWQKSKSNMAAGRHLWFRLMAISVDLFRLDISNWAQISRPRDPRWEQGGITKIDRNQNPRWPPISLISVKRPNFWTVWATVLKFGRGTEIHNLNKVKWPKLTKIKIQDGRRPWISVKRP